MFLISSLSWTIFDVIDTKPAELWSDIENFLQASKAITAGGKMLFVANKMDLNPYTEPESYYKEGLIDRDRRVGRGVRRELRGYDDKINL